GSRAELSGARDCRTNTLLGLDALWRRAHVCRKSPVAGNLSWPGDQLGGVWVQPLWGFAPRRLRPKTSASHLRPHTAAGGMVMRGYNKSLLLLAIVMLTGLSALSSALGRGQTTLWRGITSGAGW